MIALIYATNALVVSAFLSAVKINQNTYNLLSLWARIVV